MLPYVLCKDHLNRGGLLFFILLLFFSVGQANDKPEYGVERIDPDLLEDADAVVRKTDGYLRIYDKASAEYKEFTAITILNKKAKRYALVNAPYDKNRKIDAFEVRVYDKNGNLIKKVKRSEFSDVSSISDFSIYEDDRVKYVDVLPFADYPFTVEYIIKMDYKSLFYCPDWSILSDYNLAVESTRFTISGPENLLPKYQVKGIEDHLKKEVKNNLVYLKWKYGHLAAREREPFQSSKVQLPKIRVSPNAFVFDDYEGSFATWDEMGRWTNKLLADRNELPEETRTKIRALTADANTWEEKVRRVYSYLQENTRYVSIQMGIGGWQPFSASKVDEMGYGDCKALTNYTRVMLQSIGIRSHYTLVKALGSKITIDPDFATPRNFNHAILCVPGEQDTIWLECTSQQSPMGYMGKGVSDRDALIVTEDGAVIAHTPVLDMHHNQQIRIAQVHIDPEGNAQASVRTTYAGLQYESIRSLELLSEEDKKKALYRSGIIDIPSFEIRDFSVSYQKQRIPSGVLEVDLSLRRYASLNGKRLFIKPNLMNSLSFSVDPSMERTTPFEWTYPFFDKDSIVFTVPEHFHPEYVPTVEEIVTDFGSYRVEVHVAQGKIIYVRELQIKKGEYAASRYAEFAGFLKTVEKFDNQKVVLLYQT